MKGSLYANPTFIRKNIRRPTVISTRPLVAYDQNRLFFNNLSIKWQAKDIVNCTYSKLYKLLLVLSDDCRIYVFTQELQLITQLHNWQSKYIIAFELIQDFNQMLLIGTTQIDIFKVNVITNVRKTKFLSSMKFNIKKQALLTVQPHNKLKWNKGYGYILSEDLLYLWSLQDIFFYSLQKLTIRSKAVNLTKKQLSITTVFFSNYYKYTIAGLLTGQIRVWRISINPLFIQKQILIHSFCHHSRQIEQIIEGENEKSIITLGLDMYVCFMSIETFQLLRIFNFVGQYTKIYLYDHFFAYAIKESYLGELNFGRNLQFISQLTGVPINFDYYHHYNPKEEQLEPMKMQLTLNSNLGIELDLTQLQEAKQLNKIELVHIYPPLKSRNIMQVISCPSKIGMYYMLAEDGDIFRVIIENHIGKIDRNYAISNLNDSQNHQLRQNASFIKFLKMNPPNIDTQIMEKNVDKHYKSKQLQKQKEVLLIAIGCNRGSIIFVNIDDMQNIYARITYHREKILNFQEIYNKQYDKHWLISACQQNYLKIINFQNGRANCISTIYFSDAKIKIYGFQEYLALIFDKGIFEIAKFTDTKRQPIIILNKECINHQDNITNISYRQDLKLILTGGKDNKIKIWTTYKIMLYEIVLDETLKYCLWAGNKNIILVQNTKLCCLRNIPFQIKQQDVHSYNEEFEHKYLFEDQYTLSAFIEQALSKNKEKGFKIRPIKLNNFHDSPQISKHKLSKQFQTSTKKKKSKSLNKSAFLSDRTPLTSKRKIFKTEQSQLAIQKSKQQNDHQAVRKHIQQMANLKKATNQHNFPKINTKQEDIFVQFMREKLMNKKLLTRRDITLNRIILKNLIKEHVKGDNQQINSVRIQ